jgi:hypothetical protein
MRWRVTAAPCLSCCTTEGVAPQSELLATVLGQDLETTEDGRFAALDVWQRTVSFTPRLGNHHSGQRAQQRERARQAGVG